MSATQTLPSKWKLGFGYMFGTVLGCVGPFVPYKYGETSHTIMWMWGLILFGIALNVYLFIKTPDAFGELRTLHIFIVVFSITVAMTISGFINL